MSGFRFGLFVNMLIIPDGCLVKKGRAKASTPLSFDGLYELNAQEFLCHERFKASRHSLTKRADAALRVRSIRVSVQLARMIVGLAKVRCINEIRFMLRSGLPLCVYPGCPCEQRDPSSCPRGNELISSNLFGW